MRNAFWKIPSHYKTDFQESGVSFQNEIDFHKSGKPFQNGKDFHKTGI